MELSYNLTVETCGEVASCSEINIIEASSSLPIWIYTIFFSGKLLYNNWLILMASGFKRTEYLWNPVQNHEPYPC